MSPPPSQEASQSPTLTASSQLGSSSPPVDDSPAPKLTNMPFPLQLSQAVQVTKGTIITQ